MSASSDSKLTPYKPEPLAPGQIRLLYVQPAESEDSIICSLHHTFPIEDDYIAISYTWGAPFAGEASVNIPLIDIEEREFDGNIILAFGGEPTRYLTVTETMWKMIKAVGLPAADEDEPPLRAIWIDQICINQLDTSEKTEQVKMMHRVYQKAQRTIIYLGDATDQTLIGIEAAYALAFLVGIPDRDRPYYVEKYQSPNIRRVEGLKLLDWPAIQELPGYIARHARFTDGEDRLPLTPFHDLAMDILGRKWFNRTWVMQEIVCSKSAEFVIGKYKLPWDICVEACTFAGRLGFTRSFLIHTIASEIPLIEEMRQHRRVFMEPLHDMNDEDTVLRYIRSVVHRSFPKILPKVMFKGVTDPRDKIFAMLNITSDLLFYNDDGRYSNLIDYDSSIRTVYIRACELWHAGSGSQFDYLLSGDSARALSFLDWVLSSTIGNNLNLPSWIPNWVQKGGAAMSAAGPVFTAGISKDEAFRPHMLFPSAELFPLNEVPLRVRGVALSSVYCAAVVSCPTNDWKTDHIAEHAKALSFFSDPYPTTKMSYVEAYHMALEPEVSNHRFQELERTGKFRDYIGSSQNTYDPSQARATLLTDGELLSGISVSVFTAIRMRSSCLAYKRSFFVTPNGFIGLAPEDTMAGDEILLLFGGRTPYIGRKLPSGRYRFLGACYLLGVLSGEALDDLPPERIDDFTFV